MNIILDRLNMIQNKNSVYIFLKNYYYYVSHRFAISRRPFILICYCHRFKIPSHSFSNVIGLKVLSFFKKKLHNRSLYYFFKKIGI